MGIRTFYKWLHWAAPRALHEGSIDWSTFQGQRIAVDTLGFLYRAKQTKTSVFLCLADLLGTWRRHSIDAVFVFDGKSPREKQVTTAARKRHRRERLTDQEAQQTSVTCSECNDIKRFLYAAGFLCLNAEGEADSVLAYMARRGDVSAILSSDYDLLPRGCSRLLMPPQDPTSTTWKDIRLSEILHEARMSYTQFLHVCVLLGSDYSPTIPSLSYQSIHWAVRYTPDDEWVDILKKEGIRNPSMWLTAEAVLSGREDTFDTLLSVRQREKWETGAGGVEVDALIDIWMKNVSGEHDVLLQEVLGAAARTPTSSSISCVSDASSDASASSASDDERELKSSPPTRVPVPALKGAVNED